MGRSEQKTLLEIMSRMDLLEIMSGMDLNDRILVFSLEVRKRVKDSSAVYVELSFCLDGCEFMTEGIG